jgi:DNA integrity scanning protein DisA with diadenylate cyclase activity
MGFKVLMGMSDRMDRKGEPEKIKVVRKTAYPVQMLSMHGDIDGILDRIMSGRSRKKEVVRRTLDILIGLSLKGYEGKTAGAIFLIGDIEGIRRYTTQMIINPFKGWKDINVMDEKQQLTFESFSQLDGAFVLDHRGYAHYAGRMIHVKNENECDNRGELPGNGDRKGTGTRWRAAKYITERTKTVAVSLSNRGDITVFERGKEIGRIERRVSLVDPNKMDILMMGDDAD